MQFHFTGDRLTSALEAVRAKHRSRKENYQPADESVVDEVRRLLEQTSPDQLHAIAFDLNPLQLLSCITIIASDKDGDIAEKASKVSRLRPREMMIEAAWFQLLSSYPNPLLENLLKELIERKGFATLEDNPKISDRAPLWFVSSKLPMGILRDYSTNESSKSFGVFLKGNFIVEGTPMYQYAWIALLTKGTKSALRGQFAKRILKEILSTQQTSIRIKMFRHYLNTLEGLGDWNDSILEHIQEKYGKPKQASEKNDLEDRFWQEVKEEAKEAFRRWLIHQQVDSFFEGERAEFWRSYVDQALVGDVQEIIDGEGLMLDFGNFGVIEFKNVGNAAYIYPKDIFDRFWGRARFEVGHPRDYKDLAKTVRTAAIPDWDGRIVHPSGWQYRAQYRINTLLSRR